MKPLIIFLSIFMLLNTGCNDVPDAQPVERCVLSLKFNKCRCHIWDADNPPGERVVGPGIDMPIEHCDNMVGFRTNPDGPWSMLITWMDELWYWFEDRNSNNNAPNR